MGRVPVGRGVVPLPSVPAPGGAGDSWQRVDVFRVQRYAIVDSFNVATVEFDPLDSSERWQISRAVVICGGSVKPAPSVQLHIVQGGNTPSVLTVVSGTPCGLFDEADYNAADGLVVFPGEQLLAVWSGAPINSTVAATIQYELYTQAGA